MFDLTWSGQKLTPRNLCVSVREVDEFSHISPRPGEMVVYAGKPLKINDNGKIFISPDPRNDEDSALYEIQPAERVVMTTSIGVNISSLFTRMSTINKIESVVYDQLMEWLNMSDQECCQSIVNWYYFVRQRGSTSIETEIRELGFTDNLSPKPDVINLSLTVAQNLINTQSRYSFLGVYLPEDVQKVDEMLEKEGQRPVARRESYTDEGSPFGLKSTTVYGPEEMTTGMDGLVPVAYLKVEAREKEITPLSELDLSGVSDSTIQEARR